MLPKINAMCNIAYAMSDPFRVQILMLVRDGMKNCVDICEAVNMSQPAVSHHLSALRWARLIRYIKRGRYRDYTATERGVRAIEAMESAVNTPVSG